MLCAEVGNRPGSNERISLSCKFSPRTSHPLNLALGVTTDSAGHFIFDSVPPGQWEIGHWLPENGTPFIGLTQCSPVEARSGDTNSVTIGGTGWKVVGKLRSSQPSEQIDWPRQVGTKLTSEFPQSQNPIQYLSIPDASGAFEIADVLPGLYRLSVEGFPFPPGPLQPFNKQVTIPEANSLTEPGSCDLGTLDLKSRR